MTPDNAPDQPVLGHATLPADAEGAVELLEAVREDLSSVSLPLAVADSVQARQDARNAVAQLDDYILPQYRGRAGLPCWQGWPTSRCLSLRFRRWKAGPSRR